MIVTVHSYKGGTGKTLLSANLATTFAFKGKKVCLLDMDFRAPSISSLFKIIEPEYWLNDYMNGNCLPEDVLHNCSFEGLKKDILFVGVANPSTEAIRDIVSKSRKWEMQALVKLFSFCDFIVDDLGFDFVILDTSPGFQYSSVNSIVASDVALVITTSDESDVEGTKMMLDYLYENFDKKTAIILNKVPSGLLKSQKIEKLEEDLKGRGVIFYEGIECYCDIPSSEKPCFFAFKHQNHPFSRTLERIVSRLV